MVCGVVLLPHRLLKATPASVQESLLADDSSPEKEMMRRQERRSSRKRRTRWRRRKRIVKIGKSGPALPCSLEWSSVSAPLLPARSGYCFHRLLGNWQW